MVARIAEGEIFMHFAALNCTGNRRITGHCW